MSEDYPLTLGRIIRNGPVPLTIASSGIRYRPFEHIFRTFGVYVPGGQTFRLRA